MITLISLTTAIPTLQNAFKQNLTTEDLIADLSLVDWDSLSFMDKYSQHEDIILGSDDEEALEQLSQIIENPVLLENLLNEDRHVQPSTAPTSRQYDVLLSQQQYHYVNNPQTQQKKIETQSQQLILQQQHQQQQQILFEKQLLQQQQLQQQQQHVSLQQPLFPLTESAHQPSNEFNLPNYPHVLQTSAYQQPCGTCTSYLNQTTNQPSITQPSTLIYSSYPTLPPTQQSSQNFQSSYPPQTAPISIHTPAFHPMSTTNIQSMSTQSSPHHPTFENPSPLPSRTMPDMEELWDYFSYCQKQVSLKNSTSNIPLPNKQNQKVAGVTKNQKYRSHGSLSDIYPLSSEYQPPGKKLRQTSLDERKSEVANISEFEDVKRLAVYKKRVQN